VHIVETLIAERAPKLMARPKLFRAIKPLLYRMLAYDAAVFLADSIQTKTDALRVIPKGGDIIIPVEWEAKKRTLAKTKQTLLDSKAALDAGKCVIIFPSGRLARLSLRGLTEQPWQSSAAMLAKKYGAPVIPLRIDARNK